MTDTTEFLLRQLDDNFERSKKEQIAKFLSDQQELNKRFEEFRLKDDTEEVSSNSDGETENLYAQTLALHKVRPQSACKELQRTSRTPALNRKKTLPIKDVRPRTASETRQSTEDIICKRVTTNKNGRKITSTLQPAPSGRSRRISWNDKQLSTVPQISNTDEQPPSQQQQQQQQPQQSQQSQQSLQQSQQQSSPTAKSKNRVGYASYIKGVFTTAVTTGSERLQNYVPSKVVDSTEEQNSETVVRLQSERRQRAKPMYQTSSKDEVHPQQRHRHIISLNLHNPTTGETGDRSENINQQAAPRGNPRRVRAAQAPRHITVLKLPPVQVADSTTTPKATGAQPLV
ncbi:unnamed protein product [Dimorphilus gyrociliatus]|uniref:Uncharacterized protein n=1 Tax=Dimorphilus gyrociliatus TaxID=2664684 RepID=A0A7I8W7Q1_9ANNE|nr:unnamed protein product [Dimorphilus gyrociliatus]